MLSHLPVSLFGELIVLQFDIICFLYVDVFYIWVVYKSVWMNFYINFPLYKEGGVFPCYLSISNIKFLR